MNEHINFITPPPTNHYKSFKQWLMISKIILGTIACAILSMALYCCFLIAREKYDINTIDKHNKKLITSCTNNSYKDTLAGITKPYNRLKSLVNQEPYVMMLIRNIAASMPNNVMITECVIPRKKECTFQGYAQTAQSLQTFVEQLKAHYPQTELSSINATTYQNNELLSFKIVVQHKTHK